MALSGKELTVPATSTLLEAVQEVGLEVPNVYREGNCGSCETLVLAGSVDNRDVLLTKKQRAGDDRMMICVSRAAGDEITIDV